MSVKTTVTTPRESQCPSIHWMATSLEPRLPKIPTPHKNGQRPGRQESRIRSPIGVVKNR